jgi:predicted nucleic acid-binding protein
VIHLLDVNVLLALGYSAHVHNERAETWLQHLQTHNATVNLAMCSITEIGFVRVASGKAGFAANVRMAQRDLAHLKAKQPFSFLDDGLGAGLLPSWVERSKQVTDGHLLELAHAHGARLVTLDEGIPGALLIPEQPENAPMVREPPARYGGVRGAWTVLTPHKLTARRKAA